MRSDCKEFPLVCQHEEIAATINPLQKEDYWVKFLDKIGSVP
jgi:hypothetical protein